MVGSRDRRTTPCLFGLYLVVALLAHALHPDGKIPMQRTAWYDKPRRRLQMRWLLSVGMYGAISVVQHPLTPQTLQESQGRNSRAYYKQSIMHIGMYKVELRGRGPEVPI